MRAMRETMRKEFIVRPALPQDVPALNDTIARIDEETEFLAKPGEYMQRWAPGFADRLKTMGENGTGAYVLAAHGSEIIGFLGAFAGPVERTRGVIFIGHVGTRRTWRGRGVGTALFAAIEHWARAQGAWRLDLRVDTENARGLALYRKCGFAIEGRIADGARIDGARRDHFLMAKTLRPLTEPPWAPLDLAPSGMGAKEREPTFRRLRVADAALLCRFQRKLLAETPFLLMQPRDVPDEAAMTKTLAECLPQPDRFDLVAVVAGDDGDRIVGHANGWREVATRMHHDAYVSVNVLRGQWGRGIGQALAAQAEAWAREQNVRRLTGFFTAHNTRALRFAAARGFKQELVSPRYAVVDGRAVDRVRTAKFLIEGAS